MYTESLNARPAALQQSHQIRVLLHQQVDALVHPVLQLVSKERQARTHNANHVSVQLRISQEQAVSTGTVSSVKHHGACRCRTEPTTAVTWSVLGLARVLGDARAYPVRSCGNNDISDGITSHHITATHHNNTSQHIGVSGEAVHSQEAAAPVPAWALTTTW